MTIIRKPNEGQTPLMLVPTICIQTLTENHMNTYVKTPHF